MPGPMGPRPGHTTEKAKDFRGTTKKLIKNYLSKYKIGLIIVFIFAGIGMLKIFKQGKIEHILLPMIFLGGFVFHTFWETKAIYVLQYYYLLLPYAAFGIVQLFEKIEKLKNN